MTHKVVPGFAPTPPPYQVLCGVWGPYSGHFHERLGDDLGTEDGLTMKREFCSGFTAGCDGKVALLTYDREDFCTMHSGGRDWFYPYELSE